MNGCEQLLVWHLPAWALSMTVFFCCAERRRRRVAAARGPLRGRLLLHPPADRLAAARQRRRPCGARGCGPPTRLRHDPPLAHRRRDGQLGAARRHGGAARRQLRRVPAAGQRPQALARRVDRARVARRRRRARTRALPLSCCAWIAGSMPRALVELPRAKRFAICDCRFLSQLVDSASSSNTTRDSGSELWDEGCSAAGPGRAHPGEVAAGL